MESRKIFFHLKENNTTVKAEIMAGVTSFMTMAYILAVTEHPRSGGNGSRRGLHGDSGGILHRNTLYGTLCELPIRSGTWNGSERVLCLHGRSRNRVFLGSCPLRQFSQKVSSSLSFPALTSGEAIFNAIPFNLKKAVSVGIGLLSHSSVFRTRRS